jgi:AcrR family transcriptional regulator
MRKVLAPPAAAPSRRERLRDATLTEIKDAARAQVVSEGIGALSLRAVARDLGMSAPAIYRYFDSREALIVALIADIYDELTAELEAARDALPPGDLAGRLMAVSRAFRSWSMAHPAEFGLVFGSPLPDFAAVPDGPTDEAGNRFGGVFADLFFQLWATHRFPVREVTDPGLLAELEAYSEALGGQLPPAALQVFLQCWVRLYGQVALEVFGHLSFAIQDVQPLFEDMLLDVAGWLGIVDQYRPPA